MATTIRRCNYYYVTVQDKPGEGFRLFSQLAELGVDLVAFNATPVGPLRTQFALFPADEEALRKASEKGRFTMDGPHAALLAQGEDEPGALAKLHETLFEAGVNLHSASGVSDGKDGFGYVMHVDRGQFAKALEALGI